MDATKCGLIGAVVLIYVGLAVSNALYKRQAARLVTMVRDCLVGMTYSETLQEVSETGYEVSSVTLMGTGVDRIVTGLLNCHELWASSLEMMIALALLYKTIGYASIATLGFAFRRLVLTRRRVQETKVIKLIHYIVSVLGSEHQKCLTF